MAQGLENDEKSAILVQGLPVEYPSHVEPPPNTTSTPPGPPQPAVPKRSHKTRTSSNIREREWVTGNPVKNPSTTLRESVDIVHDPSTGLRDVTVRVQMEIQEDFGEQLEQFSRLKRLGRVREAQALFHDKFAPLSDVSYFVTQYAELLISAGDYKNFQKLVLTPDTSKSSGDPYGEAEVDKLFANFKLLELLSQPNKAPGAYINTCLMAIYKYGVKRISGRVGARFGSTEVQLLVLCLRLLQSLGVSTRDDLIQEAKKSMQESIQWSDIYQLLLHEDRVWDLRDLLVASVPVFGWRVIGGNMLHEASFPEILRNITDDWIGTDYDESTTLAFLDLFTSLVLQDVFGDGTDPRISLCLEYARKLSYSVLNNDPQNTKSRPFVQWILAKAAFEMHKDRGFQKVVSQEHEWLELRQGNGVQLPVFVPKKHLALLKLQDRHVSTIHSVVTQKRSLQVALHTARFLGDYNLQSTCLTLLILQSLEPTRYMGDLATLQLEKQHDKEGYLRTCLYRCLVTRPLMSITSFLRDTKQLDQLSGGSYIRHGINAPLLWARSIIRESLLSDRLLEAQSSLLAIPERQSVLHEELSIYGARLPNYITDYIRSNSGLDIPKPIQPYRRKIRFSGSTVGGKENSHQRPKRTRPRPEESDTQSGEESTQEPRGRRGPSNRSESAEKDGPPPNTGPKNGRNEVDGEEEDGPPATSEESSKSDEDEFPKVVYGDDGWPDFQIPRSFLRDHTMVLFLRNQSDHRRMRLYKLKGEGEGKAGVTEYNSEQLLNWSDIDSSVTSDESSVEDSDEDSDDSSDEGSEKGSDEGSDDRSGKGSAKSESEGPSTANKTEKQPEEDGTAVIHHGKRKKHKGKAIMVKDVSGSNSSSEIVDDEPEALQDQVSAAESLSDRSQKTKGASSVDSEGSFVEGDDIPTTSEREGGEEGLDIQEVEEDNDELQF